MKNIDVSEWKEFRVGDLFSLDRGKEPAPNNVSDGDIPLINEISSNNGISKYASSNNVLSGNSITVSVNYAQNVFYQSSPFCASVNILALQLGNLSSNVGLFLKSILSKKHNIYSYTNKISRDRLLNETIKLPTKIIPDFRVISEIIRAGGYRR